MSYQWQHTVPRTRNSPAFPHSFTRSKDDRPWKEYTPSDGRGPLHLPGSPFTWGTFFLQCAWFEQADSPIGRAGWHYRVAEYHADLFAVPLSAIGWRGATRWRDYAQHQAQEWAAQHGVTFRVDIVAGLQEYNRPLWPLRKHYGSAERYTLTAPEPLP